MPRCYHISLVNLSIFYVQFSKALNRFQKEDPTFRVGLDPESSQVKLSFINQSFYVCIIDVDCI